MKIWLMIEIFKEKWDNFGWKSILKIQKVKFAVP